MPQSPQSAVSKNADPQIVAVQVTELFAFNDNFFELSQQFKTEMKKHDEEMNKFSSDLMNIYKQSSTSSPPDTALDSAAIASNQVSVWQTIANSPLITGEGDDKMLQLKFDVSQFEPSEVQVQIVDDTLTVLASHEEKSDHGNIMRSFKREVLIPRGIDHSKIVSALAKDGVLTISAPVPPIAIDYEAKTSQNHSNSGSAKSKDTVQN